MKTRGYAFAAILALAAGAALAADSSERTSMPDRCSERDVNCVIPDGQPPVLRALPPDRPGVVPEPKTEPTPPQGAFTPAAKGKGASGSGTGGGGAGFRGGSR